MSKDAKKLIIFQQEEVNAVIMYKALAKKMKTENEKSMLEELAACEAKHAAILKKLTGRTLKPHTALKNLVMCGYTVIGKKALFKIMAKAEKAAYKLYEPFFSDFPTTVEIANDEVDHAEKLLNAVK